MFPLKDHNPTRTRPLVTLALIAVNLAVFFLWQPSAFWIPDPETAADEQGAFLYANAAVPCEIVQGRPVDVVEVSTNVCLEEPGEPIFPEKHVYLPLLVSLFLHGGLFHIGGNMWFLWLFGNNIEEVFGHLRYLAFYLVSGIVATLAFVVLEADQSVPLVGASGAIAGVLGAYLALFPARRILGLVGIWPIPLPAALFLGLWFFGQFATSDESIAWQAHASGFAFGFVVAFVLRTPLLRRLRRLHAY